MPDDIIIDSRFISPDQLREHAKTWDKDPNTILFAAAQNEILSKPKKYRVTIEKISYNANNPNIYANMPSSSARSDLVCGYKYL